VLLKIISLEGAVLPQQIRVSTGSAIALGLIEGRLDVAPSTAYLMTYKDGKCSANCGFCPQAREGHAKAELLSRVTWPRFPFSSVLNGIESAAETGRIRRVCIQALNYPGVFSDLSRIVGALKGLSQVPVSVSCQPVNGDNIRLLATAGFDRIGIALDAATENLFGAVKGSGVSGPYSWSEQWKLLRDAVEVFGRGNVSTHLIVGLGESERDLVFVIQECVDMDVLPALFAFTPVRGTALEGHDPPSVESYRRLQVARHLIVNRLSSFVDFHFETDGRIVDFGIEQKDLRDLAKSGAPFLTSGCPDCNRPFYNEKPSGPIYNYPRSLDEAEKAEILYQLKLE
jgi:biotin synthase-related radical SAM superfamily protein